MEKKWCVYYYEKSDKTFPVMEYIDSLGKREKAKTLSFIELLEEKGPNLPRPYGDFLKDGIHEIRVKLTGTNVRILYYFCFKNIIVLTNVFEKHADIVPESEINIAKKRRLDFLKRFKEDDFKEDKK